ncbi:MAG: amidohydrolase family protein [Pseudomonadota bacterium]
MRRIFHSIILTIGLAFTALTHANANDVTAFVGVHVAPMDEERILRDQTVIVEDDRIVSMGPRQATLPPEGAKIIDGAGRYLMPGLAEMHGHLPGGGADAEDILFLYVARGVTLVRGMLGNEGQFALRAQIMAGDIVGPTLYLAAPSINGNNTTTAAAARDKVRAYKNAGWDLLKVHEGLSVETYDALAEEAAAVDIAFAGHVPDAVGLARALESRQRTIDHLDNYLTFMGAEDTPVTDAMLDRAVEETLAANAGVAPTMALWEHFVGQPDDILEFEELRYISPETRSNWAGRIANARAEAAANPRAAALMVSNRRKLLKALSDGGVEILLGSDAPQFYSIPGFSVHREMQVMAEAGMSPYAILYSGTAAAGGYFAEHDVAGVITPGGRADLVLVSENPLDDIANAAAIDGVMLRGRWIEKTEIDARLDQIAVKHR